MARADFWDDKSYANNVIAEQSSLNQRYNLYLEMKAISDDIDAIIEILELEYDREMADEFYDLFAKYENLRERIENELLLNGKYDRNSAILEINAGAGGVESQDWTEMLLRMYQRWAKIHDFKIKTLSFNQGDMAGIKSVSIEIDGENAFGYLKGEIGVHRLIRISPFDAAKKRHTSFASISVVPIVSEGKAIEIDKNSIKVETYRSGGAGGQSVNTTDSAVRITHLPTNIVVSCQNERSQISNRETAMKMLASKLAILEEQKRREELAKLRGVKSDIGWGAQIRSYVFSPYTMVKDHRTNYETSNVGEILDGKIDAFIKEFLKFEMEMLGDYNDRV